MSIELTRCDGCQKLDANVIVDGKHYCKTCFDLNGYTYEMMDIVEHNRSNFEALGWNMDSSDENAFRKIIGRRRNENI
jgi:hypothetical protein